MPEQPITLPCYVPHDGPPPAIARALRYIGMNLEQPLQLQELAAVANLSLWRFATVFRQTMGISPHRYVCARRLERAEVLLQQGMSAAHVANETGFYDQSHFSRHFKSAHGLTPGQFRASGQAPSSTSHTSCATGRDA